MAARRVYPPSWLLWLAATLCGALPGGATARAGCDGHGRPAFPVATAPGPPGPRDSRPAGPATGPLPADVPRPCAGPSCSRAPAAPATARAPDRRPPDPGLVAARPAPPRPPDGRAVVARSPAEYAGPAAEPLDRPPRP